MSAKPVSSGETRPTFAPCDCDAARLGAPSHAEDCASRRLYAWGEDGRGHYWTVTVTRRSRHSGGNWVAWLHRTVANVNTHQPLGAAAGYARRESAVRHAERAAGRMRGEAASVRAARLETARADPRAEELALAFADIISDWLEPGELAEVRRRNATADYAGDRSCATQDFCDANMAMLEAFQRLGIVGRSAGDLIASEELTALWNAAWSLAKRHYLGGRPPVQPVSSAEPVNPQSANSDALRTDSASGLR